MSDIMITFNHSGNLGDILYSLYFCFECLEYLNIPVFKCNYNIQTNVKEGIINNHPYGKNLMTEESAKFLYPLLKNIGFNQITISDNCPENAFDLSLFRKLTLNFQGGDLRTLYYQLYQHHLPYNFSRKIFNIIPNHNELKNKILIIHTNRYQNSFINYKELEKFKDNLMFIGLKDEYNDFIKTYFELEYLPLKDCLDCAEKMVSSKGVIGNQSGLYAIAETLKVPRILFSAELRLIENKHVNLGPVNVIPCGGWFEMVRDNRKTIFAVNELLNRK